MSNFTATALYGFDPTMAQPTPTATPDHVGRPEPAHAKPMADVDVRRPAAALVVLLAVAVLLTQVSFRGTVEVGA